MNDAKANLPRLNKALANDARANQLHIGFFNADNQVYFLDMNTVEELCDDLKQVIADGRVKQSERVELVVELSSSGYRILWRQLEPHEHSQ